MKSWAWAAICISIASLGAMTSAAGCSSDDPAGDGDSDGEGGSGSGGNGSGATGNTASNSTTGAMTTGSMTGTPASSSTGGMMTCADEATVDDCVACFEMQFQAGSDAFNALINEACICGAMAPCAMACMVECADPMAMVSAGCNDCLTGLTDPTPNACIGEAQTDCMADPDCSEFLTEVQACF